MRSVSLIKDACLVFFVVFAALIILSLRVGAQTAHDLNKGFDLASCGRPCVIEYNGGGNILVFRLEGEKAKREQHVMRVEGYCASSCVVMVDKARPHVCITSTAVFAFHQGYMWDASGVLIERVDMRRYHSLDLVSWINDNGGLPAEGMLEMPFEKAKAFWKVCP